MKTIEQAIEDQVKTIAENYKSGKTEFGQISMNLIRMDCGLSFAGETKEERKQLIKTAKRIVKRYGLKYDNGRAVL